MGVTSKIEWTDATWEPITGCALVSEGCRNCYAAQLAAGRMQHHPSMAGLAKRNANGVAQFTNEVRFNASWLTQPLRWRKPMTIFVCSRGDLFHPAVPDEWIDQVFAVMALAPHHFFRVLTKRPERMFDYFAAPRRSHKIARAVIDQLMRGAVPKGLLTNETWRTIWPIETEGDPEDPSDLFLRFWPLLNVGLGVSVEDQATADERLPPLLTTPAVMRFVSAEPLLGAVDLGPWLAPEKFCVGCDDGEGYGNRCSSADTPRDAQCPWRRAIQIVRVHEPRDEHGVPAAVTCDLVTLDEVIVGGESGKHARPMHPEWARSLRDQCAEADVAFFFKQWGEWLPWEPEHGPCWKSQDGRSEDAHRLFPADCDNQTRWDDGLSYVACQESHAAFERVGKKAAGALLDGRAHAGVAQQVTAHFE